MLHEASNKATSSLLAVQNQGKFLPDSNISLFGRPANRVEQLQRKLSEKAETRLTDIFRLRRGE